MPRVRFTDDFDYKPARAVTIAYRAGMTCVVTRECARQATAAKKAILAATPKGTTDGKAENDG
ncbi:hypothetical protein [Rhizobium sp. WW_1]|jgi:hypothetical protein|uniref:hypothetical protein n=1 Tax=Rhizobium sp. WW_1 TaxID=1907375 RepID=UPI0006484CD2|nr:hypothetical protein [Rhizobium sp. WW_1]RKD61551.1 hypothetical protein BJ928_107152 [Rhizobium sp. WW_1]